MDFIEELKAKAKGREICCFGLSNIALKFAFILRSTGGLPNTRIIADNAARTVRGIEVSPCSAVSKSEVYFAVEGTKAQRKQLESLGFVLGDDYALIGNNSYKYDCIYDGVFIGRYARGVSVMFKYLGRHSPSRRDCISSVGRYTTVNASVEIHGDHKQGLTMSNHLLKDILSQKYPEKTISGRDALMPFHNLSIGNDVIISANAFINISKVKSIGDGAVIGAGAIVNADVPPFGICVGVPGRIKKYRFTDNQIETLLKVKWWDWDDETIRENADCFEDYNLFFEKFG